MIGYVNYWWFNYVDETLNRVHILFYFCWVISTSVQKIYSNKELNQIKSYVLLCAPSTFLTVRLLCNEHVTQIQFNPKRLDPCAGRHWATLNSFGSETFDRSKKQLSSCSPQSRGTREVTCRLQFYLYCYEHVPYSLLKPVLEPTISCSPYPCKTEEDSKSETDQKKQRTELTHRKENTRKMEKNT